MGRRIKKNIKGCLRVCRVKCAGGEEKSLGGGRHYANISANLCRRHKTRFLPPSRSYRLPVIPYQAHGNLSPSYPQWYSARIPQFGNRGAADVRVERRLAPSVGDDKSPCRQRRWHGSGSGSFQSPPRKKTAAWEGGCQWIFWFYRVNGRVRNNISRTI